MREQPGNKLKERTKEIEGTEAKGRGNKEKEECSQWQVRKSPLSSALAGAPAMGYNSFSAVCHPSLVHTLGKPLIVTNNV